MSAPRYIATQDIFAAPGVRAYRKGDEVPASAVANLRCQDKVATERAAAPTPNKGSDRKES